jgi:hypothetical protein
MKTRIGFVSNSSSSSFVIKKEDITATQRDLIWNHIEEGKKLGMYCAEPGEGWDITEIGDVIKGSVFMDNFDMFEFLEKIGVDMSKVDYDDEDNWR